MKINIDGLNNVRKATCRLSGVPVSVFLATGHSSSERVTQEFPVGNPVFNEDDYPKGSLTGQFNVFGFSKTEEHNVETVFLLVDEKTEISQSLVHVHITESTDETGTIIVNVEASTPEKLPDVEQEDGSDSGFNADVDQWGKEENTEFPL